MMLVQLSGWVDSRYVLMKDLSAWMLCKSLFWIEFYYLYMCLEVEELFTVIKIAQERS